MYNLSEEYSIWISPSDSGSGSPGPPSLFYGVSSVCIRDAEGLGDCGLGVPITEEVSGVGDKGSGDTAMVHTEALLEFFFFNMSLRSTKSSVVGTVFLNCQNIRIFGVPGSVLKEFYCI
jgi:hypothetical protein